MIIESGAFQIHGGPEAMGWFGVIWEASQGLGRPCEALGRALGGLGKSFGGLGGLGKLWEPWEALGSL